LKTEYEDHMKNVHNIIFCHACYQSIHKEKFSDHIEHYCPERLIICSYCLQLVKSKNYYHHLSEHFDLLREEIELYNENYQNIRKKYTILKNLLSQFERLLEFQDT